MSSAPAAKKPLPDIDPEAGLMLVAADLLIPLFKTGSIDVPLAREMAICAIKAYYPESSADYVNIARTIAFSMACLALLGNAGSPDTAFPEKMRAFGRANTLNRSADQSERTMMQRRRYQRANSLGESEDCGPPGPRTEQVAAAQPEAMQTEIAVAVQEYVTARGHARRSAGGSPARARHCNAARPEAGRTANTVIRQPDPPSRRDLSHGDPPWDAANRNRPSRSNVLQGKSASANFATVRAQAGCRTGYPLKRSRQPSTGFIPSGDDIDTLVHVMAGCPLVASRPPALQRPVGGWPGRPKQAPGHDGAWRVEVKAGWYYSISRGLPRCRWRL